MGGLVLDFVGAAFFAYDGLYGPKARLQASNRRTRLAIARDGQQRTERSIQERSKSQNLGPDDSLHFELLALTQVINETTAELHYWETHEQRAQRNAVIGLVCLIAGFAWQAAGAALAGHAN
jgi:hypothetical protein